MTDRPDRPDHLDHRDLNRDLAVFAGDPLVGPGLPLWLPAGAAVFDEVARLAKDLAHADGCIDVHTPVLAKRGLFERSGHLAKFADDMFPPLAMGEAPDEDLFLRPANCPHHALVYAAEPHSYRELPIRLNELAPMFRAERSGVVSGLSRVRQINLDDTHVFCRPDQVADEAARGLRSALAAQAALGLPVDHVRLSLRDDSGGWLGSAEQWSLAQEDLRAAAYAVLADHDLPLVDGVGEAAFYGPKLDLQVSDGRGHEETIATVQLDFNQPERLDLSYVGADGGRHRPVMIHRGAVGSMERVVAALLERYAGRLPFWLAPVQLVVLPVHPEQDAAARALADGARARGLRVEVAHDGSLGARIRAARQRRDHLIGVVGEREASAGAVQVRDVGQDLVHVAPAGELVERMAGAHGRREAVVAQPSSS
ncbi:threonine--tRNA ligase [Nocardioides sp.]|uniref:threonine--tRNA ligase n=1 Tax=Nocardioides sp. TaxID=35761 RepID=UPI00271AA6F8|nr:threonine--tRNA ligase [Nocardioides sp.]MDO9455363.1 threonine--tRNA ligase [Nocardioides sp.]